MVIHNVGDAVAELDFKPIKEDWNRYKLSDGSILKIRPIIFKVFETRQRTIDGNPVIGYAAMNIISAKVTDALKEEIKRNSDNSGDKRIQIEFDPISEGWNEYALESGFTLRVKLIVSKVVRTSKANQFGEPVYNVKSSNVADVEPA